MPSVISPHWRGIHKSQFSSARSVRVKLAALHLIRVPQALALIRPNFDYSFSEDGDVIQLVSPMVQAVAGVMGDKYLLETHAVLEFGLFDKGTTTFNCQW
jgi:hypothetical protein